MCFKYVRQYNCPQGSGQRSSEHRLVSRVHCSNPTPCAGDGFGTRTTRFDGPCEQHTSPDGWAAFAHWADNAQSTFKTGSVRGLAASLQEYVDNLLDLVVLIMDDALPKSPDEPDHVPCEAAVETIARELRCPRCHDDITVCPCPPGQSRPVYNIARTFRTAEAQRMLVALRDRLGEPALRQGARACASYADDPGWQASPRWRAALLHDVDPPTHEAAVLKSRRQCEAFAALVRSHGDLFVGRSDETGRVQWSALHIVGSFLTFDTGFPVELADHAARILFPMLYPADALYDSNYRYNLNLREGPGEERDRASTRSHRLSDEDFYRSYHDMVQRFESLAGRPGGRDLNAISMALDDRMEDLRTTSHDLVDGEREAFHAIAADLLPVTRHVATAGLQPCQRCAACAGQFSRRLLEPPTPAAPHAYAVCRGRAQQVHTPVRYARCGGGSAHDAPGAAEHAFCLREWARQLMLRGPGGAVTGVRHRQGWRCSACLVDPWRREWVSPGEGQ